MNPNPPVFPGETRLVEAPLPAVAAIECQSLRAFLNGVRYEPVLLSRLTRTIPSLGGQGWEVQFAVHLTARTTDAGRPICYATFVAAILQGSGTSGTLSFPPQAKPQAAPSGSLVEEALRLLDEYFQCLLHLLREHPAVSHLRPEERFFLPADLVWGVQSNGLPCGIVFEQGHWIRSPAHQHRS